MWHVGIKETYSDVYGSWIASSSQLTKRYWFHDGLDVSRETQGGVVVSFLLAVWDWVGLLMECFMWKFVWDDLLGLVVVFEDSWCFT